MVGSASTLDKLKNLIISRLYWSRVDVSASALYTSRMGEVMTVGNANGVIYDMVIISGRNRIGLYRITNI